eukprot:UN23845
MHIYAFVMLGVGQQACQGTKLEKYMGNYAHKIGTKAVEVRALLISVPKKGKPGLVCGGYWTVTDKKKALNITTAVFKLMARQRTAKGWLERVFLLDVLQ